MKQIIITLAVFIVLVHPNIATGNTATSKPLKSKTIAVDPGHGGYDPGAVWQDIYEKEINLEISKVLVDRLENYGAKVVLTRDGDYNYAIAGMHGRDAKRYDLNQRIELINHHHADIVITVHVNSIRNSSYEGAEAFYHARSLEGQKLSLEIQHELRTITGMKKRIAKTSNCFMLLKTKAPAVLVEVGYLSNEHERKLLQDPEYIDLLAQKITNGIVRYYQIPDKLKDQEVIQDKIAPIAPIDPVNLVNNILKVMRHAFAG